eukprot:8691629-Alexandrium_andersonii.AAC.1
MLPSRGRRPCPTGHGRAGPQPFPARLLARRARGYTARAAAQSSQDEPAMPYRAWPRRATAHVALPGAPA